MIYWIVISGVIIGIAGIDLYLSGPFLAMASVIGDPNTITPVGLLAWILVGQPTQLAQIQLSAILFIIVAAGLIIGGAILNAEEKADLKKYFTKFLGLFRG